MTISEGDESEESEGDIFDDATRKKSHRKPFWKESEEDYREGVWLEDDNRTLESYNLNESQFIIEFKKTPQKKRMVLVDGFTNSSLAFCRKARKLTNNQPGSLKKASSYHRTRVRCRANILYKIVTFEDKSTVAQLVEQLKAVFGISALNSKLKTDTEASETHQEEDSEQWDLYLWRNGSASKGTWLPDGQQQLGSLNIVWTVNHSIILEPKCIQ